MTYWYKLIDYWVNVRNRTGLSIPFLIGVNKQFIDSSLEIDEAISELFDDIVDSDMPQIVSLFYCGQVQEIVLGLDDKGGIGRELRFFNQTGEPTLVVANGLFNNDSSIEKIKAKLTDEYLLVIQSNNFSKNKGRWTAFTDDDLKLIYSALE